MLPCLMCVGLVVVVVFSLGSVLAQVWYFFVMICTSLIGPIQFIVDAFDQLEVVVDGIMIAVRQIISIAGEIMNGINEVKNVVNKIGNVGSSIGDGIKDGIDKITPW